MGQKRRVMLKLSGEALAKDGYPGLDADTVIKIADQVKEALEKEIEIAIVVGGGNLWRGRNEDEIDRLKSDQIGMLATAMNCLYVSEIFRQRGMRTAIFGAIEIKGMISSFDKDMVMQALSEEKVVFFAGGTGHPYFSTDSGAALRAIEIDADIILLAKAVDGVYSTDPRLHPDAKRFDTISLREVLEKDLKVIDLTASALCRENHMPLAVFSLKKPGAILSALKGNVDGTMVTVD